MHPTTELVNDLRSKIDSKKGYLRFLKQLRQNPNTVTREIARHKEHIRKHQEKIDLLEHSLLNVEDKITDAHGQLRQLEIELDEALPKKRQKSQHKINQEKLAKLQALLTDLGIEL